MIVKNEKLANKTLITSIGEIKFDSTGQVTIDNEEYATDLVKLEGFSEVQQVTKKAKSE